MTKDGHELQERIAGLAPWGRGDFDDEEWDRYVSVARSVQAADPETVEAALEAFMADAVEEEPTDTTSESKPFLLMRVVFALPEAAPESERRSFKGWANWPRPDARGEVSLAWPVSWESGRPRLVAPYGGFQGLPYSAVREYRHLRERYPFRALPEEGGRA
jgi:hypothetical protein